MRSEDKTIEWGNYKLDNEEMIEFISSYERNKQDTKCIDDAIKSLSDNQKRYWKDTTFFAGLYILVKYSDFTTTDISLACGKNVRTIQNILKQFGWQLNMFEAQRKSSLKRNYKEIRLKSRQTRNRTLSGSNIEDYIRHEIYTTLKIKIPNIEFFVGINSPAYFECSEADIPLIVFVEDSLYKFLIEVDGSVWHQGEQLDRDDIKDELFHNKGYFIYRIKLRTTSNTYLIDIIEKITNDVIKIIGGNGHEQQTIQKTVVNY